MENSVKFRNLASLNVLRSKENLKNHQNLSHALKNYECKWSFLESELNYRYVDIFYQWKSYKNLWKETANILKLFLDRLSAINQFQCVKNAKLLAVKYVHGLKVN